VCTGEQQVQLGDLVYQAEVSKQMPAGMNAIGLNFVMRENLAVRPGDSL
jgi:hypothetical protein